MRDDNQRAGSLSSLTRVLAEVLPHGLVRRIAASRERARVATRISERAQQLRPAPSTKGHVAALPRLNVGCGMHREPGWINADAAADAEMRLTVKHDEPLPFRDGELQSVFSEHFIEHLTLEDGLHFLRESARVLRPGGVFRVTCPDLDTLVAMLGPNDARWRDLARVYESIGDFKPGALVLPEQVINWAFYGHAHRYLWTFRHLSAELAQSGFVDVQRMPFGVSRAEGVAIERRIPELFYTLIVEATKQ